MGHEEVPPKWMWPFAEELEIWFERVEEERKEKYGTTNDESGDESLMDNELTRGRK